MEIFLKELKGFKKVFLKKGEIKTVTIVLNPDAFSYFNDSKGNWVTEPGKFEVLIGSSSKDIWLRTEIEYVE